MLSKCKSLHKIPSSESKYENLFWKLFPLTSHVCSDLCLQTTAEWVSHGKYFTSYSRNSFPFKLWIPKHHISFYVTETGSKNTFSMPNWHITTLCDFTLKWEWHNISVITQFFMNDTSIINWFTLVYEVVIKCYISHKTVTNIFDGEYIPENNAPTPVMTAKS
jgi:hypothetical protein